MAAGGSVFDRAITALDDAFADEIKKYFATFIGREAGDAYDNVAGDEKSFRDGLARLKTAYAAARVIVTETFQDQPS